MQGAALHVKAVPPSMEARNRINKLFLSEIAGTA
ncbi:hypothetical protein GGR30_002738 [Martelella radicis]|uniref:Uncharacterized protein n=1 Tax=Martelella radicis TaxID=1397476 RepID=A0A7W6KKD0_9HYPH|nr:hypothetical protein [Martelella radicis]